MVSVSSESFDLHKIADSGQCFRMHPLPDGGVLVLSENRFVVGHPSDDGLHWQLDCTQGEFDAYWSHYFDMGSDYARMLASVDPADEYLRHAARLGQGLRVVRQDPWETLVSFIVSQRRSVPSITTCVSKLCNRFGEPMECEVGEVSAFPSPEVLASVDPAEVQECSVGYRAAYIVDAARRVATGALDLAHLATLDDEQLLEQLMTVQGVGIKVASCTALYGFHRLDLFPIDVWMERELAEHYPGGFPSHDYPGYAGFLQLLMFYKARHPGD